MTQKLASLIVLIHDDTTSTSGAGRKGLGGTLKTYLKVIDKTIRDNTANLISATLNSGQDLEAYFMKAISSRAGMEMG